MYITFTKSKKKELIKDNININIKCSEISSLVKYI